MAVSEKINALLQIRGVKKYELAEFLEMSPQSLRNKFNRGSFSAEDLIKISGFLNCTLTFEIDERQKIILDESDIREQNEKANTER
ncbi:MAG: helix-turn-helix domain containing protein [Clostridium sp.]|nr:helix-turn-helix domain containing protein [Clostridium sp.]